jgi:hypothetical protein
MRSCNSYSFVGTVIRFTAAPIRNCCDQAWLLKKSRIALRSPPDKRFPSAIRLSNIRSFQRTLGGCPGAILMCFEPQISQVFGSLNESERSEAVGLFTEQIADRYNGAKSGATLMSGEGTRR